MPTKKAGILAAPRGGWGDAKLSVQHTTARTLHGHDWGWVNVCKLGKDQGTCLVRMCVWHLLMLYPLTSTACNEDSEREE